tara:strand:- start:332 stop:1159 length:828 start_codon:yes stop_codon:yes gene_type:complete
MDKLVNSDVVEAFTPNRFNLVSQYIKTTAGKNMKYIKIFCAVLVLAIVLYMRHKHNKYNRMNPVFLKSGHSGKKPRVELAKNIPNSSGSAELSTFCWIYINDINRDKHKSHNHIFTKGVPKLWQKKQCPSVWLDSGKNDLLIYISNKHLNDVIRLPDIPIKKWMSLSIVIQGLSVNVFRDGDLYISKILESQPLINNGDLHICKLGGFDGVISSLGMYSSALNIKDVRKLHSKGYNRESFFKKILTALKKLIGIKVNSPLDLKVKEATKFKKKCD